MFVVRTALKDIRRCLRDPAAFAIWLGIPFTLGAAVTLAFGGLSDGEAPTAEIWVVDEDESVLSGLLVTALSAGGDLDFPLVAREVDAAEGRDSIEDGDGTGLLIVPAGFEDDVLNQRPTSLRLVTNPTQSVLPTVVEEILGVFVDAVFYAQQVFAEPISRIVESADTDEGLLASSDVAELSILLNEAMIRMNPLLFPPVIDLEIGEGGRDGEGGALDDAERQVGLIDVFVPSMLFLALFFMAQGLADDIWVERRQGTLRRVLATPNGSARFLAGKLLAATAMMAAVSFVALSAAKYVLGAIVDELLQAWLWSTLSGVLLLLLVYPLQLYATSQRGGNILTSLIMMPLLMLGGSFFPFAVMPEGLVRIGRFTPNGWALSELLEIAGGRVDWGRFALSAAVVSILAAGLFYVANRRMAGAFARS